MTVEQMPALVLGLTVCAYWFCVAVKVVWASQLTRRIDRLLVPQRRSERLMWLAWIPLILLWITLPLVAAFRASDPSNWLC